MAEAMVRIHRAARRRSYTIVDNAILAGGALSLEAMGLLAHLLSRPDDWNVSLAQLGRLHGVGRDRIRRIMHEIRDAGYARLETIRDPETGHLRGTVWNVMELAETDEACAARVAADAHREPENTSLGEESTTSTESLKTPTLGENRQSENTDARRKPTVGFQGANQLIYNKPITDSENQSSLSEDSAECCEREREDFPEPNSEAPADSPQAARSLVEHDWDKFHERWRWRVDEAEDVAKCVFVQLGQADRAAALRHMRDYLDDKAKKGKPTLYAGNWLKNRGWEEFAEREARVAEAVARRRREEREKYGGVIIRQGTQQAAAWARHDGGRLKFGHVGPFYDAIVKPSEWPPSAAQRAESARDGPSQPEARV